MIKMTYEYAKNLEKKFRKLKKSFDEFSLDFKRHIETLEKLDELRPKRSNIIVPEGYWEEFFKDFEENVDKDLDMGIF